ncbi:MAG TPA: toxin TcdB middle/N-terminal domain-containing protein, partial [Polyangiaceae bacterium]
MWRGFDLLGPAVRGRRGLRFAAFWLCAGFAWSSPVQADKSGLSANKVSLPAGPGSLEGVGENVEPDLNMGLMSYRVPIVVPQGYSGLSPALALAYSSGAGNGELGLGWSLALPSVERMTSRGLPRYRSDDTFAANGSAELVRVSESPARYRARHEQDFARYTFVDEDGDGSGGYFTVEYPDGRVGYFGATAEGEPVASARVEGNGGVFRYQLVEIVDLFGRSLRFEYEKSGGLARPRRIAYVFAGSTPRYEVRFGYEARPDPLVDAKSGNPLECGERLSEIRILARGEQRRRYALEYESDGRSGGFSRLARVSYYGVGDAGPFPAVFEFGYSAGLEDSAPAVLELEGDTGVDLATGAADLVDLNGDGLPDLVETSGERHRIFLNQLEDDGTQRFLPVETSGVGSLPLASPDIDLFDLDGDGLSEMVDAETKTVLWNRGAGDWDRQEILDSLGLPSLADDANLRFFDYDNDKATDLLHADRSGAWVFRNDGAGRFELVEDGVDAGQASFSEDGLRLADMNGDGLQDLVVLATDLVAYRMNLGFGRFSEPIELSGVPEALGGDEEFVDLNGDSLADLVAVRGNAIVFAVNRDGRSFAPLAELRGGVDLDLPERAAGTSIRFVDMNGSGSTDVVYFDASGGARYVELFPIRPNLLSRIDNGLGKVIEIAYGSSVAHLVADGGADAWEHRVPTPVLTVEELVVRDERSGLEHRRRFHYSNGYYDGQERQFRGFANAVAETAGDAYTEPGTTRYRYDVGAGDRYRKGLLLEEEVESDGGALRATENVYADCPLEGVEDASPAVRFTCQTSSTTTTKERSAESAWVTAEQRYEYDGYGNRTLEANLGVTGIGEGGCPSCDREGDVFGAPCGSTCLGDERYETARFIAPGSATGGRWIVGKPGSRRRFGVEGSPGYTEEIYHYDGDDFVGLEPGNLTRGLVSRVEVRVTADPERYQDQTRSAFDQTGALVASRDANGHLRTFEYDADRLLIVAEVVHFDDRDEPYELRTELEHHPVLDAIVRATGLQRVVGGEVVSDDKAIEYSWDPFGRIAAMARPGDTLDEPTESYEFELGSPVSSVIRRTRSRPGGEPELVDVQCFDGLGRKLQTRTRIEDDRYLVSGFSELGVLGQAVRSYQPYTDLGTSCAPQAPEGVLYSEAYYDASSRVVRTVLPDDAVYGAPSETLTEYRPLETLAFDAEDSDPASPHYQTPTTTVVDGLGRKVRTDRVLATDDGAETISLITTYDELGNVRGYVDAQGNEKSLYYDLLGRSVRLEDPDSHTTRFERDAVGNVLRQEDARGAVIRSRYDEANRVVAQWEEGREDETLIETTYDALDGCSACTHLAGEIARVTYPANADGSERDEERSGYDQRGQLVYKRVRLDGHHFEIGTDFDGAGRIVARRFPGGQRVEYEYDAALRLTAVPGYVDAVTYDDRGFLRSIEFANGVVTTQRYDVTARLAGIVTESPEQGTIIDYKYSRDRVNNLLALEDESELGDAPSAEGEYVYDSFYRLSSARLDRGRDAEERLRFGYDSLDNLTRKTSDLEGESPDHVGTLRYGEDGAGPHAATSAGDLALAYDPAGFLVGRGSDEYEWDFLGRLTTARREAASLVENRYGEGATRVKRAEQGHTTYYPAPDFEVRDGSAIVYASLGARKVARIEEPEFATGFLGDVAPGALAGRAYTAEPDGAINAADAWAAQAVLETIFEADFESRDELVDALLAATTRRLLEGERERVTFLHHNHGGTTAVTTDEDGNVRSRTEHYPFGMLRYASAGYTEDYSFAGKERDESTGLTYFGARFFDAFTAQWT